MKNDDRQPDPRLTPRGVQKYLNVVEAPKTQNRLLTTLMVMQAVAILGLGLGMYRMLPLKERVPYVISVEEDARGQPTGRVTVADAGVMVFKPTEAHLRYFLGRWVEDLLSIDDTSESLRLPQSYALTKGQAMRDWSAYIDDAKVMTVIATDSSYRQRAELISISFLSDETAMIRVKLTNSKGLIRRVQVNLKYALIKPESDQDIHRNPIGLWVMTFGVLNELA